MRALAVSSGLIAAIVVLAALNVFAVVFGLSFVRANRTAAAAAAGELPPKPAKGLSRRDFFRNSLLVSLGVFGAQFGGATLAFLWPNLKGGFGSLINAGALTDIKNEIAESGNQPVYNGTGRFYIVPYSGTPSSDLDDYAKQGVTTQGIMVLYQRCVHLGCRVPFCGSSKWFECPCHGSKYNEAGEYQLGPAPHGMDRFKVTVDGSGNVLVNTSEVVLGPPRGSHTINESGPQGAFCVAPG
jgi:cytochrome b6-f complex iron-sulfur subunit